jgi:hypothetical protein
MRFSKPRRLASWDGNWCARDFHLSDTNEEVWNSLQSMSEKAFGPAQKGYLDQPKNLAN